MVLADSCIRSIADYYPITRTIKHFQRALSVFLDVASIEEFNERIHHYSGRVLHITVESTHIGEIDENENVDIFLTLKNAQEMVDTAFQQNKSLRYVSIGANLKNIPWNAFEGCRRLRWVHFDSHSQLETIGPNAFRNCESLKEIKIPATVKIIEWNAFRFCTRLEKVLFPSTSVIYHIGGGAFHGCRLLKSLTLPKRVPELAGDAFDGTPLSKLFIRF